MYESKVKSAATDDLVTALLSLENSEDCYRLLDDLLTVTEFQAIAQRLEVAKLLRRGQTFADISQATGASAATISRVNRSLHYGADGYNRIIAKLFH